VASCVIGRDREGGVVKETSLRLIGRTGWESSPPPQDAVWSRRQLQPWDVTGACPRREAGGVT